MDLHAAIQWNPEENRHFNALQLTTLHLDLSIGLRDFPPAIVEYPSSLENVQTLIISSFPSDIPQNYLRRFADFGIHVHGFRRGSCLPKLSTLYLVFSKETPNRLQYRLIINQVYHFVLNRKQHGYPLQNLQLSYMPYSMLFDDDVNRLRCEVEALQVVEYNEELI